MSGFQNQTTSPAVAALDPHKRVKYSLGMVLGVDDFEQEFAYLSNHDQWLARETIGYGTVCGLKVTIETDDRGPRVLVEPGVAISPRGQLIRVTPAQCAYINDWLNAHQQDILEQIGSPVTDQLPLYVVLCYRACPTDMVPIPGEPCRDETEATVDSRLQDDFRLELRLTAPDQTEENAVRDFVAWMSQIEISDQATSFSLADFLNAIRESAQLSSPLSPPTDYMYGSPPAGIVINRADACDYLRAAFRIWVTELRAFWRGPACEGSAPEEECLLLAELDVPLVDGQAGSVNQDNVHEEHRPYVIHLRMVQEWLLCGPTSNTSAASMLDGDVVGAPTSNTVTKIQNTAVTATAPAENQLLTFVGGQWQPADPAPGGIATLAGDVTGAPSATTVARLQSVNVANALPNGGQVLTFDAAANQWQPADPAPGGVAPLAGDVTGPVNANTVSGLQNVGVANTAPAEGQVLTFDAAANQWSPRDPLAGPAPSDVVEHPPGLPRYSIVAAGIVRANGTNRSEFPTYNNLVADGSITGSLRLTFDGYADPDGTFLYIVKALPLANAQVPFPMIHFVEFNNGIIMHVTPIGGGPIGIELRNMEFMIEVSQYFLNPGIMPMGLTAAVTETQRLNLNTASAEEIGALPGISPALARRIVAARKKTQGGFKALRDLGKIEGVNEETLRVLRPLVTVSRK